MPCIVCMVEVYFHVFYLKEYFSFSYLRTNNLILTKLMLNVSHFIFQVKIKSYKLICTSNDKRSYMNCACMQFSLVIS